MLNHTVDVLSDISSYLSILQSHSMYYFNVGGDSEVRQAVARLWSSEIYIGMLLRWAGRVPLV